MSSIKFDRFDKSIDTNVVHSVKAIAEFSQINYLDKIFSDDKYLNDTFTDINDVPNKLNYLFINDLDDLICDKDHENFDMSKNYDLEYLHFRHFSVLNILIINSYLEIY